MKATTLLLCSLALACAPLYARQGASGGALPTAETTVLAHYRLITATGAIVPEPPDGQGSPEAGGCGNPVINAFINIDASNRYIDGVLVNDDRELVDWGVITIQTSSDIVAQFTIGYGTLDVDPSLGGPGARLELVFYSGYAGFCDAGPTTVPVAEFLLTGLPGTTQPGTSAGFLLTVDLSGGQEFVLPEGEFGLSQRFGNTGGASTTTSGLLQAFAGDPDGDLFNPDSKGQVTGLDRWQPSVASGTCSGTFIDSIDGPSGLPVGSHYLLLRKANAPAAPPAEAVLRNDATNSNPLAFFPGGTPILSRPFSMIAAATGPLEVGVFLAGFPAPADLPTPFGRLLVDVTDPAGEQLSPAGLAGPHTYANGFVAVTTTLPTDLTLCGFELSVQAAQFGTALRLLNAIDLTFGLE